MTNNEYFPDLNFIALCKSKPFNKIKMEYLLVSSGNIERGIFQEVSSCKWRKFPIVECLAFVLSHTCFSMKDEEILQKYSKTVSKLFKETSPT